jgi:adenosylcobinamide-phosphate synthase
MRAQLVAAAYLLDWLIGDPETIPHPVRFYGRCITLADKNLHQGNESPSYQLVTGGLLAVGLPLTVVFMTAAFLKNAKRRQPFLGHGFELLLAASCLATRNLLDEANSVVTALEQRNLLEARIRLARIVGRDTYMLDASEISRALIETLAESLSDGIIAPLIYLTIGGVPASLAYKAINTMDSMIGHKDHRYWYFGKAAARLDDLVNYVPSRISALLLCAVAPAIPVGNFRQAWRTWLSDGHKHQSPNSGQPESAMAGALCVRLGGTNYYNHEAAEAPIMGNEYGPPSISHARAALKMTAMASILGCGFALLYLWKKKR